MTALTARNSAAGIDRAVICSGRGAWFDDLEGNAETVELASRTNCLPAVTINLRNALRAEQIVEDAVAHGIPFVRLFPIVQGCAATFPGVRHAVQTAVQHRRILLLEGDARELGPSMMGIGAHLVFLDLHAYHVADFVLMARREPGFMASTRLLNAPDSIETVAATVGAGRLCFGSRSPLHELSPALYRLRDARLSDDEWAAAAGGALLERVTAL